MFVTEPIQEKTPSLCVGSPDTGSPASFSRFVLPFAYAPVPLEGENMNCKDIVLNDHFAEATTGAWLHALGKNVFLGGEPSDLQRRNYLTPESLIGLHERARWLRYASSEASQEAFEIAGEQTGAGRRQLGIRFQPPALLLFEWPKDAAERKRELNSRLGFLIFECYFPQEAGEDQPNLKDLIEFNERFRYWRQPFPKHEVYGGYNDILKNLRAWRPRGIARQPTAADEVCLRDYYFERWAAWLDLPILLKGDGPAYKLFPESWGHGAREQIAGRSGGAPSWICHADDRAYVWTCAVYQLRQTSFRDEVARWANVKPSVEGPADCGAWVKLLNVDQLGGGNWKTATRFERRWAAERTYLRWAHMGALQGFCYHSGAMLTAPCANPPTMRHFRELYFESALLLLYLRTSLFRFSERLARISSEAAGYSAHNRIHQFVADFDELRWQFTIFTNLYFFPLVSNQQQGVELYDLMRRQMDLADLYAEIKTEIETTQEFLVSRDQHKLAQTTIGLTFLAAVCLLPGLVVSFFGADQLVDWWFGGPLLDSAKTSSPADLHTRGFGFVATFMQAFALGLFVFFVLRSRNTILRILPKRWARHRPF